MVGATYAYFQATSSGEGNIDTNVSTGTTDNLSFFFGEEIHINATEENFAQGMGDLVDSTTGTALLRPNNYTNQASATYNIYLIIENNNFEYTTENQTPEILLNVTSPTGEEIQNITGLVHTEDGFDITTRTGGFLIISDYEISADQVEEMQQWNIEVTFVNLDSDQQANTEKSLTAKLYMTQEQMSSYELIEINNINTSVSYNSIETTLNITEGTANPKKYYYGIEETGSSIALVEKTNNLSKLSNTFASVDTVEFIESDNSSYRFTNLSENTEYTIYSYIIDENNIQSNIYETTISTVEYEYAVIDSVNSRVTLNSITLTVDAIAGSNAIATYMYSKDNGNTWETTTSNTYTFNDLTDSTTYDIKIKVVDSEGIESTEYYDSITTTIYILPVVTNVEVDTTYNSINVIPTGTDGTYEIDYYLYSINDGDYQTSNVFNNLAEATDYNIKIKAVDLNGRESNIYEITVATDAYVLPSINNVSINAGNNDITINVSATGGDGTITSYHYSINDGLNYYDSSNSSYTFSSLTSGVTFYIKVYVTDSNGRVSGEYNTTATTTYPIFAEYIVNNVYSSDGVNGLYYHDGVGSYTNAAQEAGDYSYRYSGTNPNNFVCFGSDAETCPNDNLYRIIGVFGNQVKLIKYDYPTSAMTGTGGTYYGSFNASGVSNSYRGSLNVLYDYYWNTNSNSSWSATTLNTVNLNTNFINYLNNINQKWTNMIANSIWYISGVNYSYKTYSVKNFYNYELGSYRGSATYNAKIGLMYVTDYGYAASPNYWTTSLNSYNRAINNNWMYMGYYEWVITAQGTGAYMIFGSGYVDNYVVYDSCYGIRPVFYLVSNSRVTSGDGTISNPYRVTL